MAEENDRKRRAEELREEIDASRRGETPPRSPREFVERAMRERERQEEGRGDEQDRPS